MVNNEGHVGFIYAKLIPLDENLKELNEEEYEEIVEEPQDLIDKNLTCHMKIIFDYLLIYNLSDYFNKKINFSY